ncbi:MAG: zinc ribbon domain-containing protein [Candidatus Margulisbacteria bacterium]|jgi:putative FmdB family regulatory protein|nr:zinc ribbon domain-containing protein [Candidatus Margulisiibacteriota bacterium]
MPVFDFECSQCQKKFSELIFGQEKIICPHCGAKNPRQLFSGLHTISDATRLETHAADLPTMAQWEKARRTKPTDTERSQSVRRKKQSAEKIKRLSMRDLKPRAAISQARHSR